MQIPFKLKQYVIPRIVPVIIILIVLLSTSVPGVYFFLKIKEAGSRGQTIAEEAANFLRREAYTNPLLWKYDTIKLLQYVEDFGFQPSLAGILIEDDHGCIVNIDEQQRLEALDSDFIIWSAFPLVIDNKSFGRIFVGIDTNTVRRNALLLIVPFLLIGLALSGAIYFYSIRLVGKAQDTMEELFFEVSETKEKLDYLNRNLEKEVDAKTRQLQNAYEKIKTSREDMRKMSTKSIMLQEEEKKSVARDLHDSLGQTLTAIRIDMEMLDKGVDEEKKRQLLERCMKLTDEAIDELRHVVELMRPPILDYEGLEGALNTIIKRFEERSEASAKKRISLDGREIPPAVEIACYRIVQEALTNVMKHASAGHVDVSVVMKNGNLLLNVQDDGVGFSFEAAVENNSQGINNIKERAAILGGWAMWDTAPGEGCRMTVEIPLPGVNFHGREQDEAP